MLLAGLAYTIQNPFLTKNNSHPLAPLSIQYCTENKGQPCGGDLRGGGYYGVSASQFSRLRCLSSHLVVTFYYLHIFTPVISPILHFFTLKNKTSFSSHLKTQIFSLPKRQVSPHSKPLIDFVWYIGTISLRF